MDSSGFERERRLTITFYSGCSRRESGSLLFLRVETMSSEILRHTNDFDVLIWIVETIGLLHLDIRPPFLLPVSIPCIPPVMQVRTFSNNLYILGRCCLVYYQRIALLHFSVSFFLLFRGRGGLKIRLGGVFLCRPCYHSVKQVYNYRTCVCYIQVPIYNNMITEQSLGGWDAWLGRKGGLGMRN